MKLNTNCRNSTTKDKLWINSTFKKQWTLAERPLRLEVTTQTGLPAGGWSQMATQQSEVVFFPPVYKNWRLPKFKHAEGGNRGELGKRKERREDQEDGGGGTAGHSASRCVGQASGAGQGSLLWASAPTCTHRVEESPERGSYRGCSHSWYCGCTPDSCWVEGYGCSVLVCSMRGFREGEEV